MSSPGEQAQAAALLTKKLSFAANRCRQHRQELSLLLVGAKPVAFGRATDGDLNRRVRAALGSACASFDSENVSLVSLGSGQAAAILCDCERSAALAAAHFAIRQIGPRDRFPDAAVTTADLTLSAGVATAAVVPKNFEPAPNRERRAASTRPALAASAR